MFKKAVFGFVIGSLMIAAQGASANSDSPYPASALDFEPIGGVAAPMGQPAGQTLAATQSSGSSYPASALDFEPIR